MISSTPLFAWKLVSMSSKRAIEPSAPPPLYDCQKCMSDQAVWHSPELAAGGDGGGDTDGVVEGQTKGFVDLLTTLAAVEEVRLEILDHREERAARRVGRDAAVSASNPAYEGTYAMEAGE